METHLVRAGDTLFQVPLTYRDTPVGEAEDALVTTMEHSALGSRWVYDGLMDSRFLEMLAGVCLTGQGEALGMVVYDGRWHIAPTNVRITGGGWTQERVPVDEFVRESGTDSEVVLRNDRFELTVFRHPVSGSQPDIGLTATGNGQAEPVVLAVIRER